MQIDPRDYQVAVERAKADLADAEAAAQASEINVPVENVNTTSQVSSAEADVAGAQAAFAVAQKQADAAARNCRRLKPIAFCANRFGAQPHVLAKDEVSQQIYDQSDAKAKADAAAVESARADVAAPNSR